MARLTVNGDDFGMNRRCTQAIVQAFAEGLITHTTMMANGEFFEEAVLLAKEGGFADRVGVHFNLTEGVPLTQAICACPDFVRDGRFHKRYMKHPRPLTEEETQAVREELSAQILRIKSAGIIPTRADSHHYVHNLTDLAPIAAEVCREHGISVIRLNRTFDTPEHPRITENRVDNAFWQEQGFLTCAHFGRLSDVAERPVPDDTEIMVHPDYDRDGILIDRTGTADGYPVGVPLTGLKMCGMR